MHTKTLIRDYLENTIIMQLATSSSNVPWCCNVHFAFDSEFRIFWNSRPSRRHSIEIEQNQFVAAAIAKPHEPNEKPQGVQLEGIGRVIKGNDPLFDHAFTTFTERFKFFADKKDLFKKGYENETHTFWYIKPSRIVLFDTVHFPDQPQQELVL